MSGPSRDTVAAQMLARLEQPDGMAWFRVVAADGVDDRPPVPSQPEQVAEAETLSLHRELQRWLAIAEQTRRGKLPAAAERSIAHETLLDLAAVAPEPWGETLASAALVLEPSAPSIVAEDRVGDYRLLEPIGRGGMGVVWRALQLSTQREVAVKLVRPDQMSREAIDRFIAEGKLLAQLSHPGIPHVLQIGVDDAAGAPLPFLAMELVAGASLHDHLAEHQPNTADRLRLLLGIAEAVAHAHDRGVVHRDLKPDNIIVAADGQTKVLDFGVARLLSPLDDDDAALTRTGQIIGTISYMSPEQARGERAAVDERTDVYALGAIAYEMFTGAPPHDVVGLPVHEAVARIAERTPQRLDAIVPGLPRDLVIVVGTALAAEPERRYATGHELAADLRRLLDNRPVFARPPSLHYVLRKFVGRHRLIAGAAVLVVLSLGVGLGFAVNGWHRAVETEDFLSEILHDNLQAFGELAESVQPPPQIRAVLERQVTKLTAPDRPRVTHPGLRRELARLLSLLGDLDLKGGDAARATQRRDQALQLSRELADEHPGDLDLLAAYAIAEVKVGDLAKERRDVATARRHYERALAIDERLATAHPSSTSYLDDLVWSYMRLADLDQNDFDLEAGIRHSEAAVRTAQSLRDLDPERTSSHYAVYGAMMILAAHLTEDDRVADRRRRCLEMAMAAANEMVERQPERASYRTAWAHVKLKLGWEMVIAGRMDEARRHAELALIDVRARIKLDPASSDLAQQLATAQRLLAHLAYDDGDRAGGRALLGQMVAAVQRAAALQPESRYRRHRVAVTLHRAAIAAAERDDPTAAHEFGSQGIAAYAALLARDDARAIDRVAYAELLMCYGPDDAAEQAKVVLEAGFRFSACSDVRLLDLYIRVLRRCGRNHAADETATRVDDLRALWDAQMALAAKGR